MAMIKGFVYYVMRGHRPRIALILARHSAKHIANKMTEQTIFSRRSGEVISRARRVN